ncbi:MAG: site-specific integrase [Ruminococcaceae bacterium]|nr:site-specific integrase [Oscillospiraceae bacterium]
MICSKCNTELPDNAVCCWACGKKVITERKHRKRSNGTGSITKLSGNRAKPWIARKNDVYIGSYATRVDAQKALERLTDIDINEKFNYTFKQVHDLWLPEHERTIGEHGKGNYKTALNNCQELHDLRFRSLRTSDFQKVIIRLEEKGLSKSSCEKVLQLFGQLSDWAIREGICQTNYARFCTITAEQKSKGQVFPPEAIAAIKESKLEAAKVVLVLLATGCRGNELFTVPLSNCFSRYFIGGSKTSSGKNRVIPVAADGLMAYQAILTEAKSRGGKLFIDGYNGNKTYANFAKREFKELMNEIGLEGYTPYDCRHTFTTQAIRAGIDKQTLRRILGHADLSTTDKYYTHLDLDDILNAVDYLDLNSAVSNKLVTQSAIAKII